MLRAWRLATAATLLAGLVVGSALGDLKEVERGVLAEDFEDGKAGPFEATERGRSQLPETLEVVKDGGKAALHVKGTFHTRAYYKGRKLEDFVLQARMRKAGGSYAGVVVRDHWRVYFQMRGYLSLNSGMPGWQGKGELFKSGQAFKGYHDLKVVCAGPVLRAFVDGQPVFTYTIPAGEGRVGFYSHGGGEAFVDAVRLDTRVAPEHYVLVEAEAPDHCLVFLPDGDATLRFRVANYSDAARDVAVTACVKAWGGEALREPRTLQVHAPAGGAAAAEFALGRLAAGFYRVEMRAECGGKECARADDLPLAIQKRGEGKFRPPAIPVGVYYKYFNARTPLHLNTYAHAAARSLREHHFNAVVADPSFTEEAVGIFQSYGIATIARGRFLEHPGVIATLAADEPKPEQIEKLKEHYQRLRQATGKPITTCMVGEGIGLGTERDPVRLWRQLDAELRCFRWYGIKKSFYGLLHETKYKGWLPLSSVFRIVEASSDTPYWFVAPGLGKTVHEAYYHKPTPAETRGMMHLALAYGADGILFWAFQSHGSWPCLVDQKSLAPTDGDYAAAAEVAALVEKHAGLLAALRLGGLDVRCPSPAVDARPLHDPRDGKVFVYAVNKDARNPAETRLLLWAERWALTSVRDVYTGRQFKVEQDDEGYLTVPLALEPGQGLLLATDVKDKAAK